jgi:Arm DNA-binding domain
MPKRVVPLSPSAVANAKPKGKPYKMADGRGLYLLVQPSGARWWRWTYRRPDTRKENTLSLGIYPDVKLQKARERREQAREQVANGIDPSEQRQEDDAAKKAAAANTFEAVACEWLARKAAHEWGPTQTVKETRNLEKHVLPKIGKKPIDSLDVDDLSPIVLGLADAGHHELAHRLRANLSRIMVYAAATKRIARGMTPPRRSRN